MAKISPELSIKSLTAGLSFHGEVQGKRQHYYVLSSVRQYFIMSLSKSKPGAGNFNLVSKSVVDQVFTRLRGQQGVTAKTMFNRSRNRRLIPSPLAALSVLYILVATGRASIFERRNSPELYFNVKRRPP